MSKIETNSEIASTRVTRSLRNRVISVDNEGTSRPSTPSNSESDTVVPGRITRHKSVSTELETSVKTSIGTPKKMFPKVDTPTLSSPLRRSTRRRSYTSEDDVPVPKTKTISIASCIVEEEPEQLQPKTPFIKLSRTPLKTGDDIKLPASINSINSKTPDKRVEEAKEKPTLYNSPSNKKKEISGKDEVENLTAAVNNVDEIISVQNTSIEQKSDQINTSDVEETEKSSSVIEINSSNCLQTPNKTMKIEKEELILNNSPSSKRKSTPVKKDENNKSIEKKDSGKNRMTINAKNDDEIIPTKNNSIEQKSDQINTSDVEETEKSSSGIEMNSSNCLQSPNKTMKVEIEELILNNSPSSKRKSTPVKKDENNKSIEKKDNGKNQMTINAKNDDEIIPTKNNSIKQKSVQFNNSGDEEKEKPSFPKTPLLTKSKSYIQIDSSNDISNPCKENEDDYMGISKTPGKPILGKLSSSTPIVLRKNLMNSSNGTSPQKELNISSETDRGNISFAKSWSQSVRVESGGKIDELDMNDAETINKEKTIEKSITSKKQKNLLESSEEIEFRLSEEEDIEDEEPERNEFIDDEAEEVDDDSINSEELNEIKNNEIPVDGVSIGSNDTTDKSSADEDDCDKDSFIVSDTDELCNDLAVEDDENEELSSDQEYSKSTNIRHKRIKIQSISSDDEEPIINVDSVKDNSFNRAIISLPNTSEDELENSILLFSMQQKEKKTQKSLDSSINDVCNQLLERYITKKNTSLNNSSAKAELVDEESLPVDDNSLTTDAQICNASGNYDEINMRSIKINDSQESERNAKNKTSKSSKRSSQNFMSERKEIAETKNNSFKNSKQTNEPKLLDTNESDVSKTSFNSNKEVNREDKAVDSGGKLDKTINNSNFTKKKSRTSLNKTTHVDSDESGNLEKDETKTYKNLNKSRSSIGKSNLLDKNDSDESEIDEIQNNKSLNKSSRSIGKQKPLDKTESEVNNTSLTLNAESNYEENFEGSSDEPHTSLNKSALSKTKSRTSLNKTNNSDESGNLETDETKNNKSLKKSKRSISKSNLSYKNEAEVNKDNAAESGDEPVLSFNFSTLRKKKSRTSSNQSTHVDSDESANIKIDETKNNKSLNKFRSSIGKSNQLDKNDSDENEIDEIQNNKSSNKSRRSIGKQKPLDKKESEVNNTSLNLNAESNYEDNFEGSSDEPHASLNKSALSKTKSRTSLNKTTNSDEIGNLETDETNNNKSLKKSKRSISKPNLLDKNEAEVNKDYAAESGDEPVLSLNFSTLRKKKSRTSSNQSIHVDSDPSANLEKDEIKNNKSLNKSRSSIGKSNQLDKNEAEVNKNNAAESGDEPVLSLNFSTLRKKKSRTSSNQSTHVDSDASANLEKDETKNNKSLNKSRSSIGKSNQLDKNDSDENEIDEIQNNKSSNKSRRSIGKQKPLDKKESEVNNTSLTLNAESNYEDNFEGSSDEPHASLNKSALSKTKSRTSLNKTTNSDESGNLETDETNNNKSLKKSKRSISKPNLLDKNEAEVNKNNAAESGDEPVLSLNFSTLRKKKSRTSSNQSIHVDSDASANLEKDETKNNKSLNKSSRSIGKQKPLDKTEFEVNHTGLTLNAETNYEENFEGSSDEPHTSLNKSALSKTKSRTSLNKTNNSDESGNLETDETKNNKSLKKSKRSISKPNLLDKNEAEVNKNNAAESGDEPVLSLNFSTLRKKKSRTSSNQSIHVDSDASANLEKDETKNNKSLNKSRSSIGKSNLLDKNDSDENEIDEIQNNKSLNKSRRSIGKQRPLDKKESEVNNTSLNLNAESNYEDNFEGSSDEQHTSLNKSALSKKKLRTSLNKTTNSDRSGNLETDETKINKSLNKSRRSIGKSNLLDKNQAEVNNTNLIFNAEANYEDSISYTSIPGKAKIINSIQNDIESGKENLTNKDEESELKTQKPNKDECFNTSAEIDFNEFKSDKSNVVNSKSNIILNEQKKYSPKTKESTLNFDTSIKKSKKRRRSGGVDTGKYDDALSLPENNINTNNIQFDKNSSNIQTNSSSICNTNESKSKANKKQEKKRRLSRSLLVEKDKTEHSEIINRSLQHIEEPLTDKTNKTLSDNDKFGLILSHCNKILGASHEVKINAKLEAKKNKKTKKIKNVESKSSNTINPELTTVIAKALKHSEALLSTQLDDPSQSRKPKNTDKTGLSKHLPLNILKAFDKENSKDVNLKAKVRNVKIKSSKLFVEEPLEEVHEEKKIKSVKMIKLPSGPVKEEPITPLKKKNTYGFEESSITPQPPKGFKIRNVLYQIFFLNMDDKNDNETVKNSNLSEEIQSNISILPGDDVEQKQNLNEKEKELLDVIFSLESEKQSIIDESKSKIYQYRKDLEDSLFENEKLKRKVSQLEQTLTQSVVTQSGSQEQEELLIRAKTLLFEKSKVCKQQETHISTLRNQVDSIKAVLSVTKDMLNLKSAEVEHMESRLETSNVRIKAEKDKCAIIEKKLDISQGLYDKLRAEYDLQSKIFKELKETYEQKINVLTFALQKAKEE